MISFETLKSRVGLQESQTFYNHVVNIRNGLLFIDNTNTKKRFSTIETAKDYISESFKEKEFDTKLVASIIRKQNPSLKITNSIVEQTIRCVKNKEFSIDPAVLRLREFNEGKRDYILRDSSHVAIDADTQKCLNVILKEEKEIVDYMKQNKKNFVRVIKEIKETQWL